MFISERAIAGLALAVLSAACATTDSGSPVPTTGPNLGRVATAQEVAATIQKIFEPKAGAARPGGSRAARTAPSVAGMRLIVRRSLQFHVERTVVRP